MEKMEWKPFRTSALSLALLAVALVVALATINAWIIMELAVETIGRDGEIVPPALTIGEVVALIGAINSVGGMLIVAIAGSIGKLSEDAPPGEDPVVTAKRLELKERRLELEEAKRAKSNDVIIVERTRARAQRAD